MQDHLATREQAIAIGKQMQTRLPELSGSYPATKSGKKEYTSAAWAYFDKLRKEYEPAWTLYPVRPSPGRAKGEFLTDFSLFDGRWGYRIACESEWNMTVNSVGWAFDKLMAVKADVKILVFQAKRTADCKLPHKIEERLVKDALSACGHHHPGHECYLLIQFDGSESRLFFWEPQHSGPFSPGEIYFEYIA